MWTLYRSFEDLGRRNHHYLEIVLFFIIMCFAPLSAVISLSS